MSRIAFVEGNAGASGDMLLGALVDLGVDAAALEGALQSLKVPGWRLKTNRVVKAGISATQVTVALDETANRKERRLADITRHIEGSALSNAVKAKSMAVFKRLAEAEGVYHGEPPDQVHFHEVGGVDALVDVVGNVTALEMAGIEALYCGPLNLGSGNATFSHGTFPVPVPAVAELMKGFPCYPSDAGKELLTPTGAAILTTLATFTSPPPLRLERIAVGAGGWDLPFPNVLRMQVGAAVQSHHGDETVTVVETTIDDCPPQVFDHLFDRLYAAGALEAFLTPAQMKKTRPGVNLTVLALENTVATLADIIFEETTTLGVRTHQAARITLDREIITVTTPYGTVPVKVSRLGGVILNLTPEYDAVKALAQQHGVPLRGIMEVARAAAAAQVSA